MAIFLACALFSFSRPLASDTLTDPWHMVSDGPLYPFPGPTHLQLDSRPTAGTASGITDLAETTAGAAQTEANAHFP